MPAPAAPTTTASAEFTSDLTRKLVNEADLITRLAPADPSLDDDMQAEVLSDLMANYDTVDAAMRKDLLELAGVLGDAEGQALRAVVCRPGKADITVSGDDMAASLTVTPPEGGGRTVTTQDVVELLRSAGICFGVDMTIISTAVNDAGREHRIIGPVQFATGRAPVVGLAGRLEPVVGKLIAPAAGGRRGQQWMVKAHDVLVRVIPPTSGEDGTTITGQVLPAEAGAAATIEAGEGVIVDDAGMHAAANDGLAIFDGQRIEVRRQLVWPGDLTLNDPQIEFDGSVNIVGSVRDGARVAATGDIDIRGGVEGATVISHQGAVIVRQGIAGRGCGFVSAKTTVDVRYLEHATVYCAGDVIVRHAMIHSRATLGGTLLADSGKGVIFGGEVRAGVEIRAKSIGNTAGIATRVSVGHDWKSLETLRDQEAVVAALSQQVEACERVIEKFKQARSDPQRLTPTERGALSAVLKRHIVLKLNLAKIRGKQEAMDAQWALTGDGKVICLETAYAGVTVKLGPSILRLSANLAGCVLSFGSDKGKIVAKSSSGRELKLD